MQSTLAESMVLSSGTTVANNTRAVSQVACPLEQGLIQRVQAGDHEAFYELVRPYERAVFLSAVAIVKNEADAEEVAQEAVLKAFKALGRFRQEAKFSTWLIQITMNEAKMRLRKDKRHLYESIEQDNKATKVITPQRILRTGGNPVAGFGTARATGCADQGSKSLRRNTARS